jgi:protein-S-isoprenylcysteine O-methyltransferase Ste14
MELTLIYLSVVLGWLMWCALHSALISITVTDYLKKTLGVWFRFYRLFYNTVSLLTLIPLVYYSSSLQGTPVFRWEGGLVMVKYALFVASVTLFIAGGKHYSMAELLGIRQIKTGRANRALSEYDTFDTSGILKVIRHPWYTAGILIVWSQDISLLTLLINIVISTYFVIGAHLEERKLLREFGTRYREYQKQVSMFIPYTWLKGKIAGLF